MIEDELEIITENGEKVKSKSENSKVLSENRINRPKKIMQEVRTEDDTKKINSPQDALVSFLDDIL